jgi:hypothetical protein
MQASKERREENDGQTSAEARTSKERKTKMRGTK